MGFPPAPHHHFPRGSLLCILIIFLWGDLVVGQNLAPNGSFETYDACPSGPGSGAPLPCIPWKWATQGTPDYFNACANPSSWGVPNNFFGSEGAYDGAGYTGAYLRKSGEYREYIQAPLEESLSAGIGYYVRFYVSLADQTCGIQTIGALFSVGTPPFEVYYAIEETPQIESDLGYISNYNGWVMIEGCFIADGGEDYITIGNFHNDADTPVDPDCPNGTNDAYYYIEDVLVMEVVPLEDVFELGDPVTACDSYTIDPELTNVLYHWSDGSDEPTLTVTSSGWYYLTISYGCESSIDSILVTIEESFQVALDPGLDSMCTGESYVISLDPDLGEYIWSDGSTGAEFVITESGTYSVTLDDGCAISSDQITINVLEPPDPFELGIDTFLCDGDEIEFMLDPSLGDFLWQDNTTSSNYIIGSPGMYSLTISNYCGEQTSEINITSAELPTVDLSEFDNLLCANDVLTIALDPAAGTYVWQDGTTGPVYEITSGGLYSVTVSNACGSVTDEIDVQQYDIPQVELADTYALCQNDSLLLNLDTIDGNFLWQDGSTGSSFLITQPGTYSVTVDNDCGVASAQTSVAYSTGLPSLDLGPDLILCPGESAVLSPQLANVDYLWQDGSTADTLLVTSTGMYIVEISDGCTSATDTVMVSVSNSPPVLDLPAQINLCQGDAILLEAPVSGVTYLWSNGTTLSTILVTQPGSYSLTISNACGTDRDTVIVSDSGPAPYVDLGNDTSFCEGHVLSLTPDFSNVGQWLWHDGSTLPSFDINAPGQISVQVTNACGVSFDTINVAMLPDIPPLDLGADTSLCPGETVVLNISIPNVDILWSDGSTDPAMTTSAEGLYFASITNTCGVSYDTMEVTFLPDIPPLNLGPDQSLCPGETITIDPGIIGVDYLWHDGSTLATYSTTQQETIILTVSNACGAISDTLEVIENNQGPVVDLGPDILACEGEIINIPAGISGVHYLWQDGSTASSFSTSVSGEFFLQVSNACGTDADTILVDIHGIIPVVDLGGDTTLCEGEILLLTSSAISENTIVWQDGSGSDTYEVLTAGTYSLFESNHCGEDTDTITVVFTQAPEPFDLGADSLLCPGESITLFAPNTSHEILWQDGSDQLTMIADQPQTYWLQISNECGAVADSLIVSVNNNSPVLHLATSIPWCEGDLITLDATQSFAANYQWSTGAITSSITITEPDLYEVVVSTQCQVASTQVDVYPGDDCIVEEVQADIFIPNVFSPNQDGVNDEFVVFFGPDLNVIAMQGNIYDRWGNLVYSSDEIPFSWNGFFKEKIVQPGVYVYTIKIITLENNTEQESFFAGDVTVIR